MVATAPRRKSAVLIDGNITEKEYGHAAPVLLDSPLYFEAYLLKQKPWNGVKDSSGSFRMVWDESALYVGVQVTDDKLLVGEKALYNGDSIELYFDTATDKDMFSDDFHKHQGRLNCAPVCPPDYPVRMGVAKAPGGAIQHLDAGKAQIASRRTEDGYTIELKIPVSDVKLAPGIVWGFDASVIDYDGDPGGQKNQMVWHGGHEVWSNPHKFGFLMLSP